MKLFHRLLSMTASVACLAPFAASTPYTAQGQLLSTSGTPAAVLDGRAVLENHYDPSRMLRLAIVLAPPHWAEEQQFLNDVQDKQSPLFHQFLKAEEWNARFSPAQADEQAVADWAASQGLKVTQRYPNRLVVDVEAPAGTIEKALQVTINQYRLNAGDPVEERVAFSNDRDPQLPARLQGIVATVQGLNSVEQMRPLLEGAHRLSGPDYVPGPVKTDSPSYHHDAAGKVSPFDDAAGKAAHAADAADVAIPNDVTVPPLPAGVETPAQFWASSAYDYQALLNQGHCCNPLQNPGRTPPETSIAIAAYGDVNPTDVNVFAAQFNLAVSFEKHIIDGNYTCNNNPPNPDPNCEETTLDTEWAIAHSNSQGPYQNTAFVAVYEAPNANVGSTTDLFNHMANDGLARTMSTSFGCGENSADNCRLQTLQGFDSILAQMAGEGWTLVAATGDQGATVNCTSSLEVQFPSTDPNVIAVGGTQLSEGSVITTYEVAWTGSTVPGSCAQNNGGSTGGFSIYFPPPAYQQYLGFAKRAVPDIALDATLPHPIFYNGGWLTVGGTSDAAPMIAGFFAQENAYLLSLGDKCGANGTLSCSPLGNANYPLYNTARYGGQEHFPFYDILTGCNSNDNTLLYQLTPFCAQPGYDEVTGWGAANMLQLAWSLNYESTAAKGKPYVKFTGPAINVWHRKNHIVSWTVHDFAGANFPQSTGVGIAGFTQGWDGLPTDSYNPLRTATNDLFYAGPQFPNATGGCLSLAPGVGCSGGVPTGQGCHTVYVHGWNNEGMTTTGQPEYPETYGPVCYDSIPPVVQVFDAFDPDAAGWYNQPTPVYMDGYDVGNEASGIKQIFYGINSPCGGSTGLRGSFCRAYSQPITLAVEGVYNITGYAEDVAGNVSAPVTVVVRIDRTPPVTRARVEQPRPGADKVTLVASDALSGVMSTFFQLDQGPVATYAAPIEVIGAGLHTLTFWSVDYANNQEAHRSATVAVR